MTCEDVHCGVWIDWAKGRYTGSTLTLSKTSGLILVAFLALFVRYTGSHLWGVITFICHQCRSAPSEHDDFYHQTQVVLRNSQSESTALWDMTRLWWTRKQGSYFHRALSVSLIAVLHMAALGAAGLLSSKFIVVGDEALVRSPTCGWMDEISNVAIIVDEKSLDIGNALLVSGHVSSRRSLTYSRTCYGNDTSTTSLCSTFIKPRIESANISGNCPFDSRICGRPSLTIDTGYIRSDRDLGINSHERDRIYFRKVMKCAPLLAEKYTRGWEPFPDGVTPLVPNDTMKSYYFGPLINNATLIANSTFSIANSTYWSVVENPYQIYLVSYLYANMSETTFLPIPELSVTDSDIYLIGLRVKTKFIAAVNDPWFNATYQVPNAVPKTFISTHEISTIGCSEQYQFCSSSSCTPLTGLYGITADPAHSPTLNPTQKAVFQLLWKAVWGTKLDYAINFLRNDVLVANDYMWDRYYASSTVPDTQWQTEMWNFHNLSLALLQRRVVEFASPLDIEVKPGVRSLAFTVRPKSPELRALCNAVKIRTTAYGNFSVLGLALTLSIGSLIIGLNLSLATVVGRLQRKLRKGLYQRLEWEETSVFQLQRIAWEGRGIGPWHSRSGIPMTMEVGQKFSTSGLKMGDSSAGGVHDTLLETGRNESVEMRGESSSGMREDDVSEMREYGMSEWREYEHVSGNSSSVPLRQLG